MNIYETRVYDGLKRGEQFEITVDGEKVTAYEGETVGAALLAAGRRVLGYTNKEERPRGLYCGIGLCQGCRMVIDGAANTLACQTPASPGCEVKTQKSIRKDGDQN